MRAFALTSMKLLVAARYHYYGDPNGIEPQFYYLAKVPEAMGHEVDYFDFHYHAAFDLRGARRMFRNMVKSGSYDAVFVATNREEFDQETIEAAARHAPIIAWNSDDEFKWDTVTGPKASWFTFMVTNSPEVFEQHKARVPNLIHAQWACTGFWDGRDTAKDIDFSFVGQAFGKRRGQIAALRKRAGLAAWGRGTGTMILERGGQRPLTPALSPGGGGGDSSQHSPQMPAPSPFVGRGERAGVRGAGAQLKQLAWRLLPKRLLPYEVVEHLSTIDFDTVNRLWNRSRISFTPLDNTDGTVRQIKSRVFDMGLSGTLMLSHTAPRLDDYYEPGKEYVPFETLDECVEKARYYLRHEAERRKIAEAYAKRTQAEHLWRHRIGHVLKAAGLK